MAAITPRDVAIEIAEEMSTDDVAAFTADGWRDGVSAMLTGEWAGLDLDDVMEALDAEVGWRCCPDCGGAGVWESYYSLRCDDCGTPWKIRR